jgi:exopolysaccharide production protein ExoQ
MNPGLAFIAFAGFSIFLIFRGREAEKHLSPHLWLVFLWMILIGSKPVSVWIGMGRKVDEIQDYMEGSAIDRNILILLILAGIAVLGKRKIRWKELLSSNPWLFLLLSYSLMSVIWSVEPYICFKRWIKEFGNIVMVLIIITDADPRGAVKAAMGRFAFVAVPISVMLIKYFPDLGRYYNRWTWEAVYCGVTTNKNELGCAILICGLYLINDFVGDERRKGKRKRIDILCNIALIVMMGWLLKVSHCASALVCMIMAAGVTIYYGPWGKGKIESRIRKGAIAICLCVICMAAMPWIWSSLMDIIGRDSTLTGRTGLWQELMEANTNAIIGSGYQSFWIGPEAQKMWDKFSFHPIQAHNGYLETFLNLGIIGVCLLIGIIIKTGINIKECVMEASAFGAMCLSIYLINIIYNWTEAFFGRPGIIWFAMLIIAMGFKEVLAGKEQKVVEEKGKSVKYSLERGHFGQSIE